MPTDHPTLTEEGMTAFQPEQFNPYFRAWCRATGRDPAAPFLGLDYTMWISACWRDFKAEHGLPLDVAAPRRLWPAFQEFIDRRES